MKWKYSVGLVLAVSFLIMTVSFGYRKEYEYAKEQRVMTVQGDAIKEEIFYLKELNGYVVVYMEDGKSIYEYTDIRISDLPKNVQQEVIHGKKITGIEKVYGFLENYSS